ncbi:MAG: hypothetical protein ACI4QG_02750 [Candidatus Cryptobacteroides sp.]
MKKENIEVTPGSASEWYDLGVSLMRQTRFGDAINAFNRAAELASEGPASEGPASEEPASEEFVSGRPASEGLTSGESASGNLVLEDLADIKKKSLASIEVIQEIIGFVNKDLMNP